MKNQVSVGCVKEVLMESARIMRTGGIARGVVVDRDGRHCLLGAIIDAVPSIVSRHPTREKFYSSYLERAAIKILAEALPDWKPGLPVDHYNRRNDPSMAHVNKWSSSKVAWWSNMMAKDAEEAAQACEKAASKLPDTGSVTI